MENKDEVLHYLNHKRRKNTLLETLDIEFTYLSEDTIKAKMPVTSAVHQPRGYLHGGASVVLAESVGSTFSALHSNLDIFDVFGLEIAANHIKAIKRGYVFGTAKFVHKGKQTHVLDIEIRDEKSNLVSKCKMTNILVQKKEDH